MKSRPSLFAVLILSVFLSWNCSKNNSNPISPKQQPVSSKTGQFSVKYMNGLSKVSSDSSTFDLGDLRGSKSFYFILQNTGSTDITDITLTPNDSSVTVTPSHIDVLNTTGSSSILQTIKVTVNHGTVLENGVGSKPLQPMGDLTKLIHIEGTSGGLTSLDLTLHMYSYLMSASIYDNSKVIDLTHPYTIGSPDFSGIRIYKVNRQDSIWTFKNTGNVPIRLIKFVSNTSLVDTTISLAAQDTTTIIINWWKNPYWGIDDVTGTVFDSHKFTMDQPTGYLPFGLWD